MHSKQVEVIKVISPEQGIEIKIGCVGVISKSPTGLINFTTDSGNAWDLNIEEVQINEYFKELTKSINDLIKDSNHYIDIENIIFHKVKINPTHTFVNYEYKGVKWIDIWKCDNGKIPIEKCDAPDMIINMSEATYPVIISLLDS